MSLPRKKNEKMSVADVVADIFFLIILVVLLLVMAKKNDEDEIINSELPSSPDNIKTARVQEFLIDKNGNERRRFWRMDPVDADFAFNILQKKGNENRKLRFFCPVCDSKIKDRYCDAELTPWTGSTGRKCFRTAEGSFHKHIFAERNRIVSEEVVYNPESFLKTILVPRKREKNKEIIKVYEDFAEVPVESPDIVQPSNLKEYYIQTRNKNMLDYFPDSEGKYHYKYCEGLINRESIENFRSGYYQFAIPILAIGEYSDDEITDCLRNENSKEGQCTIVLRDPFRVREGENATDRLYFIFFADRNPCKPGKKYLVLCDWKDSLSQKEEVSIGTHRKKTVRIVRGNIEKVSVQIQLLDDGLFGRMEGFEYFKPELPKRGI